MGKPSNFRKFNRPSYYGTNSVFARNASTSGDNSYQPPTSTKPVMRQNANRAARPVSDGYFLGKTDHLADDDKVWEFCCILLIWISLYLTIF